MYRVPKPKGCVIANDGPEHVRSLELGLRGQIKEWIWWPHIFPIFPQVSPYFLQWGILVLFQTQDQNGKNLQGTAFV